FGSPPTAPQSESVAQIYMRWLSGSYELGGQFTAASGFHTAGDLVKGVKILPSLTSSNPSGAMSMDCGTIASPTPKGCVAEVNCCGSCITGVSTTPSSGLPVSRSSRYTQPVLPACAIPLRALPSYVASNRMTGFGAS